MSSVIDPAVLLDPDTPTPTIPSQTAMAGRLAERPREGARPAGKEAAPAGEGRVTTPGDGGYEPAPACSSAVAGMKVEGSNLVLTLARHTDPAKATDPKNYQVMVNGSLFFVQARDIVFDPHSRSVTFRRLPLRPGDHVRITVLGLWDVNPYIPTASVTCHMQVPQRRRWWNFR